MNSKITYFIIYELGQENASFFVIVEDSAKLEGVINLEKLIFFIKCKILSKI